MRFQRRKSLRQSLGNLLFFTQRIKPNIFSVAANCFVESEDIFHASWLRVKGSQVNYNELRRRCRLFRSDIKATHCLPFSKYGRGGDNYQIRNRVSILTWLWVLIFIRRQSSCTSVRASKLQDGDENIVLTIGYKCHVRYARTMRRGKDKQVQFLSRNTGVLLEVVFNNVRL